MRCLAPAVPAVPRKAAGQQLLQALSNKHALLLQALLHALLLQAALLQASLLLPQALLAALLHTLLALLHALLTPVHLQAWALLHALLALQALLPHALLPPLLSSVPLRAPQQAAALVLLADEEALSRPAIRPAPNRLHRHPIL